ncbi:thioesterase family protein [Metapseudomonas boanensis]|uniref:Thioesterase family protein n=1 Tax=Metapseudomonas boanensis TaxID=2822138 RepID=A0ABS5XPS7_9GAMM|nr:thioesterase family protein [Pseudomonas boanensis]MBT8769313.1 thioesterase family protein [Pseudomonas boanensis]
MTPGTHAEAELVVQASDSAKALSLSPADDFPEVFSTSRMIALMELAAARCMKPLLSDGELSVGVGVDIRHLAATPMGVRVHTRATYVGREGKLYAFKVEAFDDGGLIGEGHHTRAIVSTKRLLSGAHARNNR